MIFFVASSTISSVVCATGSVPDVSSGATAPNAGAEFSVDGAVVASVVAVANVDARSAVSGTTPEAKSAVDKGSSFPLEMDSSVVINFPFEAEAGEQDVTAVGPSRRRGDLMSRTCAGVAADDIRPILPLRLAPPLLDATPESRRFEVSASGEAQSAATGASMGFAPDESGDVIDADAVDEVVKDDAVVVAAVVLTTFFEATVDKGEGDNVVFASLDRSKTSVCGATALRAGTGSGPLGAIRVSFLPEEINGSVKVKPALPTFIADAEDVVSVGFLAPNDDDDEDEEGRV